MLNNILTKVYFVYYVLPRFRQVFIQFYSLILLIRSEFCLTSHLECSTLCLLSNLETENLLNMTNFGAGFQFLVGLHHRATMPCILLLRYS